MSNEASSNELSNQVISDSLETPVLALRDVVVYPQMVIPLFVGREKSIRCLDIAMENDKKVFLVAQKDPSVDDPQAGDVFEVGTVATLLQMLKLPDGTVKVLVEGLHRAKVDDFVETRAYFSANISPLTSETADEVVDDYEALIRSAIGQFEGYVKLNKKIPPEVLTSVSGIDDADQLADTMAAHMPLKIADKQKVLEINNAAKRLEYLMALMEGEIDLLQVEKKNPFTC
jgi:ATP-dependent Lon protease